MKVLGVSCSARLDRNTADLLNLSLETLRSKGVETELLQLANFRILPCQRCDYQCLSNGERDCPIKDDDVPKIWKQMTGAYAIIFGVPVYGGTIPSLLKILLERSQALVPEERPKHPQVTGVIILGSYGHLNVLAALAPTIMYYPFSKPVGYVMAMGWDRAVENERTRRGVIVLAENVHRELCFGREEKRSGTGEF